MVDGRSNKSCRVDVSAPVLSWALARSGNPLLLRKFPKLSEWMSGKSGPTLRQLETLARATRTPLGFFFLAKPPEMHFPIPMYRTSTREPGREPSPDLIETVQTMRRRQNWMRDYLIEQGISPLSFVRSGKISDEPVNVAKSMRATLGLEDGWASRQTSWNAALRQLLNRTESAGILVVVPGVVGNNTRRKLDPHEFRGFVLVDDYAPLILVNGQDGKAAQMFTVAHELAHVWFGVSAAFDLEELQPANDGLEIVCDRVAAEFLVPQEEFRRIWAEVRQSEECLQLLARHFKVSELVIARRLLDLGHISRSDFHAFYQDYLAEEHSAPANTGGDFYLDQNARIGRRFAEAVIRAAREGELLYRQAYQLTGLYGNVFEEYARKLGLGDRL